MYWLKITLQVALLWLKRWLTIDAKKRTINKEAVKDVRKGIKSRDRSAISRAFDRVR